MRRKRINIKRSKRPRPVVGFVRAVAKLIALPCQSVDMIGVLVGDVTIDTMPCRVGWVRMQ